MGCLNTDTKLNLVDSSPKKIWFRLDFEKGITTEIRPAELRGRHTITLGMVDENRINRDSNLSDLGVEVSPFEERE